MLTGASGRRCVRPGPDRVERTLTAPASRCGCERADNHLGRCDDDAYSVTEIRAPAGASLPPHVYENEDSVLVVLAGEIEAVLATGRSVLHAGESLSLPRAQPRRLHVLADARLLCVSMPAGLERLADLIGPSAPDEDDRAALLTAAGVALLPAGWGADGK